LKRNHPYLFTKILLPVLLILSLLSAKEARAQRAQQKDDKFWIVRVDLWNPLYMPYIRNMQVPFPAHWSGEAERHFLGKPGITFTSSLEVNVLLSNNRDEAYFFFPTGARIYLPPKWSSRRPAEGLFVGAQVSPFLMHLFRYKYFPPCPACPPPKRTHWGLN
jgi:hypothetical protein